MKKENIGKFDHCFGCGVCAAACPKKAISIELQDGFYSPVVNENLCVECSICLDVCAFAHQDISLSEEGVRLNPKECFAAFVNDDALRKKVTSGGIAYALAKTAVSQGWSFCGVRYNIKEERAEHYIAEKEEDIAPSIGSKYIQSYTVDAFSSFEKDKKFLVVGTPCQIDSLRRWARKRKLEDNFLFIDFFCHGVPSIAMWRKYLEMVRQKTGKETLVKFRSKAPGWHESTAVEIEGEKGRILSLLTKGDIFYAFFLGDRCLNRACYDDCKYKWASSAADIRIGDFWGKKYRSNDEGVSGVVCFTEKGIKAIKGVEGCTITLENFEDTADFQKKKNARRAPSYKAVKRLLKTDRSIESIHKTARRIEFPKRTAKRIRYYFRRTLSVFKGKR